MAYSFICGHIGVRHYSKYAAFCVNPWKTNVGIFNGSQPVLFQMDEAIGEIMYGNSSRAIFLRLMRQFVVLGKL